MSDLALYLTLRGRRRKLRFPDAHMLANFAGALRAPLVARSEQPLRVVDVGACCGGWTVAQWASLPKATFACFEPWPAAWPYLEHNLKGVPATLYTLAASDRAGTLGLAGDPGNLGKTSAYGPGEKKAVPCARLDEVDLGAVDILKVDAEGHELAVLRGADGLLRRDRPWVVVEILTSQLDQAGRTLDDVPDFLRARGYGEPRQISSSDWLFQHRERRH